MDPQEDQQNWYDISGRGYEPVRVSHLDIIEIENVNKDNNRDNSLSRTWNIVINPIKEYNKILYRKSRYKNSNFIKMKINQVNQDRKKWKINKCLNKELEGHKAEWKAVR